MTRRITKQIREDAWLICAIAASSGEGFRHPYYRDIGKSLDVSEAAMRLAGRAWEYAIDATDYGAWTRAVDAEAAALLAEGWTPEGWE